MSEKLQFSDVPADTWKLYLHQEHSELAAWPEIPRTGKINKLSAQVLYCFKQMCLDLKSKTLHFISQSAVLVDSKRSTTDGECRSTGKIFHI